MKIRYKQGEKQKLKLYPLKNSTYFSQLMWNSDNI